MSRNMYEDYEKLTTEQSGVKKMKQIDEKVLDRMIEMLDEAMGAADEGYTGKAIDLMVDVHDKLMDIKTDQNLIEL